MTGPVVHPIERSRTIPVSSLHQVHREVLDRKAPTIALHVGEPHVRMPEAAIEALGRAARDGLTDYTDAPGWDPLRERLANELGPGVDAASVFVTPGSCQALVAVMLSVARDGAAVLLPDLHWPTHLQQIRLAGLEPRHYRADHPGGLEAALEEAFDPSVCAVIVNSPANPTGFVHPLDQLAAAHRWAVARAVWILSDEAYEDFVFEGVRPDLWALDATVDPADRRVFSIHTFSKGYSMTGCRLGWVAVPTGDRAQLLARVQEACLIAPSTPVQVAGLAALDAVDHLRIHHDYVRATRDAVVRRLGERRLLWGAPAGGWYALLDVSPWATDAAHFCRDLLDRRGLALAPGGAFAPIGSPPPAVVVRLTLCAERQRTLDGLELLVHHVDELPGVDS